MQYSSFVDLLLLWGQTSMCSGDQGILDISQDALQDLLTNPKENTAENLEEGVERLISSVQAARSCLHSSDTLFLTEDDAELAVYLSDEYDPAELLGNPGLRTLLALRTLDHLIFVVWALDHYADLPESAGTCKTALLDLMNDLLTENQPPAHRLIVINRFRRKILKMIPKEFHCLFPWYEDFHDMAAQSLAVISETMAGVPEGLSQAWSDDHLRFYHAVTADEPLFVRLEQESQLWREIPLGVKEAVAWRLLRAATRFAANAGRMPQGIIDKGMLGCAIRVVCSDLLSGQPEFYWRFRPAFCGLELSDEEQLHFLQPIEEALLAGNMPAGQNSILDSLSQWFTGNIADDRLAGQIFSGWIRDLKTASNSPFVSLNHALEHRLYLYLLTAPHPKRAAQMVMTFDRIQAPVDYAVNALQVLFQGIADTAASLLLGRFARDIAAGPDDRPLQDRPPVDLSRELPCEPLPLPAVSRRFGNVMLTLFNEKETEPLRTELSQSVIFWAMEIAFSDGTTLRTRIRRGRGDQPIILSTQDIPNNTLENCQMVQVVIGNSEDAVTLALRGAERGEQEVATEVVWFWLTYLKLPVIEA